MELKEIIEKKIKKMEDRLIGPIEKNSNGLTVHETIVILDVLQEILKEGEDINGEI